MPGELLERKSVALVFSLSAARGKDFSKLTNLVHVKTAHCKFKSLETMAVPKYYFLENFNLGSHHIEEQGMSGLNI